MCTAAQLLANRSNAQRSTGPVTPEGKAGVSGNATKLGLFSTANFVRPDEQEIFDQFASSYTAELSPQTPLEQTLAREMIHAAWRLRRCADVESAPPEEATDEELDRIQASVDRARTTAQRAFHRALAELRRVQTERVYRKIALPDNSAPDHLGQASCRQLDPAALVFSKFAADEGPGMAAIAGHSRPLTRAAMQDSAKQSRFEPARTVSTPGGAPPCGSR